MGNFLIFLLDGEYVGVTEQTQSGYQLSPAWMAAVGNAAGTGAFFGTILNGHLVAIFGQKRVLVGALVLLSCFLFMTLFAPNIQVLFVGQFLCGFPWGVFATTAPAYASEVLPMSLRVYLTSWTNMCFIVGQLVAAGVLRACLERDDEWGFRIPFAVQWTWPAILIPLLCFAPESPWHLVRQRRIGEAERSLRRLQRASADVDVKDTLAAIVHTNSLEEGLSVGTSYWDCFRGFERRRTEIACVCFAGQVLSGAPFAYNASYFFEQVGLAAETTYSLNLGGTALALVGTLVNWFCLMPYYGRRTVYLGGMLIMAAQLCLIGILNVWTTHPFVATSQAALTLVWTFSFQMSVGQLGWAVPAEVGSTRLRQKTVCLARNAYYLCSVGAGVVQPYLMNPTALNLRGYTGFVWGVTALLTFVWAVFRLPETKDRTYEQLDVLFAKRVPARKFATTHVDDHDVDEDAFAFANYDDDDDDDNNTSATQVPRTHAIPLQAMGEQQRHLAQRGKRKHSPSTGQPPNGAPNGLTTTTRGKGIDPTESYPDQRQNANSVPRRNEVQVAGESGTAKANPNTNPGTDTDAGKSLLPKGDDWSSDDEDA
jgi:SP family general alpha glucoside:H+ symporter-like MFS transporter